MKSKTHNPLVMFALGAVIALLGAYAAIYTIGSEQEMTVPPVDTTTWQTVTIGEVMTVEIPTTCRISAGAGSRYVVCPTAENDQPTPEFTLSSDGETVNIRRWENLESPYWDHMISSIRVIQPMERDITINVQK